MNNSLPAGTRLRGGALLVEEALRRDEKALVYRVYDVPARYEVTLYEFFPADSTRNDQSVAPPAGWSAQGFQIAKEKFAAAFPAALFSFEENGTVYCAQEYSLAVSTSATQLSSHATVALTPLSTATDSTSVSDSPIIPQPEREVLTPSHSKNTGTTADASPTAVTHSHRKFSLRDILPDALRGAVQGAIAGAVGGVLLGILAALIGSDSITIGVLRGLIGLPIGALAGALLGALRALPSNAPQLATASARTPQQQLESTLSGAGKGALLGFFLGGAFLVFSILGGMEFSFFVLLRAIFLFALSGAFAGGIVGFIRIDPRDRSRK